METKNSDRRVKYTKMVIKDSFVKFLKEKPLSKITVKEICEDADINRATFYAHYTDQYDLLQQIENEIIGDINLYLNEYNFEETNLIDVRIIERILDYIADNAELFDLLLNLNGDMKFQQEFIIIIGQQHFLPILGSNSVNKDDAEYLFHFLASGAVGVIQMWLKSGMKKSARDISELILKTSNNGRTAYMPQ
ncbi:regulatory protein TetR [Ruminiclostridium papyrosolvens DSM 2782]|uniref:Regulatory protein TetR n=1 Tax=Ruminiclostridium papyrosolvens DSM 2782 TaxID=588581 RepID=F1T848_9FIRM|nr:TetR-like C-terminal domain-containing protein [Ruminiclostridium papyrosolvens]EGD49646.1 regulatory protein TetR [Ruminiclostridium papyrosolvens DSM 2782]WES33222.1 TetR-like C-terminal domain-containing protein [Ruminiclostridium papyrosolvens DSM 2782]